jgi:hypothetical protein
MKKDYTRTWLNILLAIAVMNFIVGFYCGRDGNPPEHKCPEPTILSILELQEAVGAKPDGIVGPETIRLWQQYERDVIFNGYAAEFMTVSGGPKEK